MSVLFISMFEVLNSPNDMNTKKNMFAESVENFFDKNSGKSPNNSPEMKPNSDSSLTGNPVQTVQNKLSPKLTTTKSVPNDLHILNNIENSPQIFDNDTKTNSSSNLQ